MKNLTVKFSNKYRGYGVFADKNFNKGEIVNKYKAVEISKHKYEALSDKEKGYINIKDNSYYILDKVTKFINHSCNPNTVSPELGVDVAKRNIKKGQEITAFYLVKDADGMTCVCGSRKCQIKVKNKSKYS